MSNVFQTCLKGFKLKKLVFWAKNVSTGWTGWRTDQLLAQPIEVRVDSQLNRSMVWTVPGWPLAQPIEGAKKLFLSCRTVVQPIKVKPQPVEVQRSLAKHEMLMASQPVDPQRLVWLFSSIKMLQSSLFHELNLPKPFLNIFEPWNSVLSAPLF